MPRSARAGALLCLALLLSAGTDLSAQATFGRLTLTVKDDQGQPAPGVRIIATCDGLAGFRDEKTTNKKGKVTFAFADATYTYNIRVEVEGYNPVETRIKPEIKKTIFREVTIEAVGRAAPPPADASRVIYTPAEKVFNQGVKDLEAGDREAAKAKFLEALSKDGSMALAHSALAGLYLGEGDHEAAIASAGRLLELEPRNSRGLRILYQAHRALGNQKQAEAALESLSELGGGETAALIFNEAVDALDVGDTAAAKARFEEALEIDPDLAPALSALAGIYMGEKSYREAAAAAEKLLALEPDNLKALRIRHDAYTALGDADKAREAEAALLTADPKMGGKQLLERAVELFEGGDAGGARELFERALEVDPGLSRAHYRLGLCLISLGDNDGAKEHLRKFLDLAPADDPEAPAAREMLGFLE